MEHGKVVIGCDLDTRSFDAQIDYVESQMQEIEDKLKQADMGFEVGDTQKLEANYEKLGIKLDSLRKKQAKLNQEQAQMGKLDLSGVQAGINNVNKGLQGTIKKVAKWGLAVFGIRTAYNVVRNVISMVSGANEGVAKQIDVMKQAIANALTPLVQTVLNLVARLMMYINYIVHALTGRYLFDFSKAFADVNKSSASTAKNAERIKKSLAGFDEMNILEDTSSTGATGGGGGISIESIKNPFEEWQDFEAPSWLDGIVKVGQWVIDNWQIVVDLLLGTKMFIDILTGNWVGLVIDFILVIINHLGDFKAVAELLGDAWNAFWNWFADILDKALTWIADLGAGATQLFMNAIQWIVDGVIAGWNWIIGLLSTVGTWIYNNIIKPVADFFSGLWQGIKDGVGSAVQWVKDKFKTIVDFFGNLISKIVGLFKKIGTKVGDAISGAFKAVINGVLKAIENILNFPIKSINKLINVINKVPGINLGTLPTFKLPRLAKGGIINQPGRGIPVGSAIGGERGQEGVIPLTDSQQMELLGQSIGKYVNINLTNITKLDNRQIAKEQRRINAQNDFAFNR